jgi:diguanylate cyclase
MKTCVTRRAGCVGRPASLVKAHQHSVLRLGDGGGTMGLLLFDDMDVDYAASVAERTMRSMSQRSVPATPSNYSVWFNYVLGSSPGLNKAVDILVSNKRPFDASINRGLYATYVMGAEAADSGSDTPKQLQDVIQTTREALAAAITDNRTQIETLGEVTSELKSGRDPALTIARLTTELSAATRRAAAMEEKFAETSGELDKIRDALDEAEQRSKTDALTGLANRRWLDEFLRSALILAMEKGEPLSIFMIDIDHFKRFNDTHGHQVGDQVLRLVARFLRDGVREVDLAARYGGEELVAVLPGASLVQCKAVAERIRERISRAKVTRRTTGEEIATVTVSIGVAQFRLAESVEAMIERCDRGLYLAKQLGRNQTVTEQQVEGATAVQR